MSISKRSRNLNAPAAIAATMALAMMLPVSAAAQTCVGGAGLPAQFSLNAGASFTDGATGYSLGSQTNLDGPIGFGAAFGIVDFDDTESNMTTLSLEGSYDLPVEGIAACPIAGFGWGSWSDAEDGTSGDISTYSFPLGMSVGTRIGDDGAAVFLPNARAGLVHQRISVSVSDPLFGDFDESDSETEFFFGGGATVLFGKLFGTAGVSKTTFEGSDAVFSVGIGVVF